MNGEISDSELDCLIKQSNEYRENAIKKFNSDGVDEELPQEFIDKQLKTIDRLAGMNSPGKIEVEKLKVGRMKKVRAKKRTLDEFKNWLEGLSEFQPENWIPSKDQWEHIKTSIAAIREPIIVTSEISHDDIIQPTVYAAPVHVTQHREYVAPVQSSLDAVPVRSTAGSNQHIDMRKPNAIKTDIDTSDGNYTSDFE